MRCWIQEVNTLEAHSGRWGVTASYTRVVRVHPFHRDVGVEPLLSNEEP